MATKTKTSLSVATLIQYLFDYAAPDKMDKIREDTEKAMRALEEDENIAKGPLQDERDALRARYREWLEDFERFREECASCNEADKPSEEHEKDGPVSKYIHCQELIANLPATEMEEEKGKGLQPYEGSAQDLLRRFSPNLLLETPVKDQITLLVPVINAGNLCLASALRTVKDNLEIIDQPELEYINETFKQVLNHKKKIESKKTLTFEEATFIDCVAFQSNAHGFLQLVQTIVDMGNVFKLGGATIELELGKIVIALNSH